MVGTFRTISVFGAGNPALMADSIAESLVTTQNGLLAALPLMLLHNYLWNKSVNLEKDVLKSSQRLINYLGNNDFNTRLKL
jgi:biopolymer transport protein ExbB